MSEQTAIVKVTEYMQNPISRARISDIVGAHNAGAYISSVLLAVANSEALQKCTPASIYTAAIDAANLRLSVSPATGQAYIVPFKGHATLVVGYKGLYHMAVRTNRYRYINVGKIYEGQVVIEDQITGLHRIEGTQISKKKIGWIGAFEMIGERGVPGLAKTVYMTVEEIHEHASKYSPAYNNPSGKWKTDPEAMERKTVLRRLITRWGYIDPVDAANLSAIEDGHEEGDAETVEGEITEAQPVKPRRSEAGIMAEIGFDAPAAVVADPGVRVMTADEYTDELNRARDMRTPGGRQFGELTRDELAAIANHDKAAQEQRDAAQLLLSI